MAPGDVSSADLTQLADDAAALGTENREYFHEHAADLREEYGGHTIAIVEGEVVAAVEGKGDHRTTSLINGLRHEFDKQAVAESYITYVSEPDDVMIL